MAGAIVQQIRVGGQTHEGLWLSCVVVASMRKPTARLAAEAIRVGADVVEVDLG